jgi:hypothetical protein
MSLLGTLCMVLMGWESFERKGDYDNIPCISLLAWLVILYMLYESGGYLIVNKSYVK